MKWKLAGLVLGVVCLGMVASAKAAFEWDLAPAAHTRILLKFANYEQVHDGLALPTAKGDMVEGIFAITQIIDKDVATTSYWSQKKGQHLVGYFKDYLWDGKVDGIAPIFPVTFPPFPTTGSFSLDSTGGMMKVFFDNTNSVAGKFNALYSLDDGGVIGHGKGYDKDDTGVNDNANFTLWLSMVGAGGIVPADPSVTLHTTFDNETSPFTGKGSGYLEIVGGDYAGLFEKDVFGPGADLFLQSDIKAPGDLSWPASSHDPIEGEYVPEPASLLIWGLLAALVGLMAVRRRK